jgi:hypothetical protein
LGCCEDRAAEGRAVVDGSGVRAAGAVGAASEVRAGVGVAVTDRAGTVITSTHRRHRAVEFQEVPHQDRHPGSRAPGRVRGLRQLRHPRAPHDRDLAGRSPTVHVALHPDLLVLAEPGRTLVRLRHRRSDPTQRPPQHPGTGSRPPRLGQSLERRQALHLDQDRRPPKTSSPHSDDLSHESRAKDTGRSGNVFRAGPGSFGNVVSMARSRCPRSCCGPAGIGSRPICVMPGTVRGCCTRGRWWRSLCRTRAEAARTWSGPGSSKHGRHLQQHRVSCCIHGPAQLPEWRRNSDDLAAGRRPPAAGRSSQQREQVDSWTGWWLADLNPCRDCGTPRVQLDRAGFRQHGEDNRFSASTSAVKTSTPPSSARRARARSSAVPSPRPCQASMTVTAISAVRGSSCSLPHAPAASGSSVGR